MAEPRDEAPADTRHLQLHDLLPAEVHRSLLGRVDELVARVGPESPEPPPPSDDPLADPHDTGFDADLGDLWPEIEAVLRAVAGLARRELDVEHFVVDGVRAQLTVHRADGTFATPPFGRTAAGGPPTGTRRIEFVYTFAPDPDAYEGGQLRLHDTVERDGSRCASETFHELEPIDNAVVFFPSDAHHEVVRLRPTSDGAVRYTLSGWLAGDPVDRRPRPELDVPTLTALQIRYLPRHSPAGFLVRPTPAPVQDLLASLRELRAHRMVREEADPRFQDGGDPDLIDVGDVADDVLEHLRPIHEEFAGVRLVASQTYGLRLYRRGQQLRMHLDRSATHVVSSVLQVAQDVDRPWPLQVDVDGRRHEVVLNPGQMLLYEGASCLHGRITPFEGEEFANLFVHYRPVDWPWSVEALTDAGLRDGVIDREGRLRSAAP